MENNGSRKCKFRSSRWKRRKRKKMVSLSVFLVFKSEAGDRAINAFLEQRVMGKRILPPFRTVSFSFTHTHKLTPRETYLYDFHTVSKWFSTRSARMCWYVSSYLRRNGGVTNPAKLARDTRWIIQTSFEKFLSRTASSPKRNIALCASGSWEASLRSPSPNLYPNIHI